MSNRNFLNEFGEIINHTVGKITVKMDVLKLMNLIIKHYGEIEGYNKDYYESEIYNRHISMIIRMEKLNGKIIITNNEIILSEDLKIILAVIFGLNNQHISHIWQGCKLTHPDEIELEFIFN